MNEALCGSLRIRLLAKQKGMGRMLRVAAFILPPSQPSPARGGQRALVVRRAQTSRG